MSQQKLMPQYNHDIDNIGNAQTLHQQQQTQSLKQDNQIQISHIKIITFQI